MLQFLAHCSTILLWQIQERGHDCGQANDPTQLSKLPPVQSRFAGSGAGRATTSVREEAAAATVKRLNLIFPFWFFIGRCGMSLIRRRDGRSGCLLRDDIRETEQSECFTFIIEAVTPFSNNK